ncbi:MAG: rod-binding protein [Bacillota bacterium]
MDISSSHFSNQVSANMNQNENKFIDKNLEEKEENKTGENKKLKNAVNEFSSILIQKMFQSMRDTLSEEKLVDGGFAEDVFTDMMDKEISQLGSEQNSFNSLNDKLYRQLLEQQQEIQP